MGLFGGKPKVSVKDFCRRFYDSAIFKGSMAGIDYADPAFDAFFRSLVQADRSFAFADKSVFAEEITALRLELTALAWAHRFRNDRLEVAQSVYTRKCLEEHGRSDLWGAMSEYNRTIGESQTSALSARRQMLDRWQKTIDSGRIDQDQTREEVQVAVSRALNRLCAEVDRQDCPLVSRLTAVLAARLGCTESLNSEALLAMSSIVFGLYRDSVEAIKDVRLVA